MKHRLVRLGLASAVAFGLAGLSGCETNQLGAAAIVENQRITVSSVQGTLDRIQDQREARGIPGELGPDAARAEVERRVLDMVFERAAADLGIVITAADVAEVRNGEERTEEQIADLAAQNMIDAGDLDELYRRFTIERAISDAIDKKFAGADDATLNDEFSKVLIATAREMNIRINPRYGKFDPTVGQIQPLEPDFYTVP